MGELSDRFVCDIPLIMIKDNTLIKAMFGGGDRFWEFVRPTEDKFNLTLFLMRAPIFFFFTLSDFITYVCISRRYNFLDTKFDFVY